MYHPEDQNLSKNIDIIREYDLLIIFTNIALYVKAKNIYIIINYDDARVKFINIALIK